MNFFKYLYESWAIWIITWLVLGLGHIVYVVLAVLASSDPSAGAVLPFMVFIFPIFFLHPAVLVFSVMVLYKLGYWLYDRYTD